VRKCTRQHSHFLVWGVGVGAADLPSHPSRFQDQEWIRPNGCAHFSPEFVKFHAVPVEAVDVSSCAINYHGLDNLCEWAKVGGHGKTQQFLC
jgi:hypothetical protein